MTSLLQWDFGWGHGLRFLGGPWVILNGKMFPGMRMICGETDAQMSLVSARLGTSSPSFPLLSKHHLLFMMHREPLRASLQQEEMLTGCPFPCGGGPKPSIWVRCWESLDVSQLQGNKNVLYIRVSNPS